MKKFLIALNLLVFFPVFGSFAQDSNDFYKDVLFSKEVQTQETRNIAEDEAKKLLNTKQRNLSKNKFPTLRKNAKAKKKAETQNLSSAPFGLSWGATITDTKDLGVTLKKIELKDYINSYSATHLPKPIQDFRSIDITFGQENELWRIISYGNFLDDDADANKVLRLYRIYFDLLQKKYGNGQEFFTPKVTNVDYLDNNGKKQSKKEEEPKGNPNFLQQLQSGQAELYATFSNSEVGAALSVNIDSSNKSYIIIDYKNLRILRSRETKTIDAL